jgi:hypothetical protein
MTYVSVSNPFLLSAKLDIYAYSMSDSTTWLNIQSASRELLLIAVCSEASDASFHRATDSLHRHFIETSVQTRRITTVYYISLFLPPIVLQAK